MGDKLSNVLIVFIMVVILGLGGMYYIKIVESHSYSMEDSTGFEEGSRNDVNQALENTNQVSDGTNTIDNNTEEKRIAINQNTKETETSIYVDTNQAGYKYNNRYYYRNLDTYSKAIYDSIANNIDNLKKGNYVINIDYDFRVLLKSISGQKELKSYYDDAVNALNLDIPNLFYIDFSKMYLKIEEVSSIFSTKYKLYIDSDKNPNYYADGFSSQAEVEFAINQVEKAKDQIIRKLQGSDYSKLKAVHDWIIDNMEYDLKANKRASVYGGLIDKRGVCEAYARTYKYILDEIGIGNVLVTGTSTNSNGSTEDHMWNYVQLNGNWYAVDVTWDDPIIIGGGTISEETKHKYFLLGSKHLFTNHTEKYTISSSGKLFMPPKLMVNKY